MNKNSKNKRRLAIGAVVAAGVTTGTLAANMASDAAAVQPNPETELTAADRVVVDGQTVDFDQMLALQSAPVNDRRARTMYGVRKPRLYGPKPPVYGPPRPKIKQDTVQMPDTIAQRVVILAAKEAKVDPQTVNPKSNLTQDLGLDLLGVVELLIAIEREYNMVIPDEALDRIKTVEDIIKFIKNNKNNN